MTKNNQPSAREPNFDALSAEIFAEMRILAERSMANEKPGHTLRPSDLVQEAWVRLSTAEPSRFQNRSYFLGAASEAMRRILVEHARKKAAIKRGGDWQRVEFENLEGLASLSDEANDSIRFVDEALDALATEHPRQAQVVRLVFFAGHTYEDAAQELGISPRTAKRDWQFAKAWIHAYHEKNE